eukprot:2790702-Rhodomonas_salina.2
MRYRTVLRCPDKTTYDGATRTEFSYGAVFSGTEIAYGAPGTLVVAAVVSGTELTGLGELHGHAAIVLCLVLGTLHLPTRAVCRVQYCGTV